ncbi:MAG: endonuclease Q family protein [Candidatus Hodarchaeales archaeon]|jgi:PHP family Zn ribbon phosphoesterase
MELALDLHAHSIFAGGTQALKITPETLAAVKKKARMHLENTNITMPLKGIDLIGTGDCQFNLWTEILKENLKEENEGIFRLRNFNQTKFLLQTEIIFTLPIGKRSKITHVIFLFPDFTSVDEFRNLLDKWEVKHEKMARPFVKCTSPSQISNRINSILDINPWIEAIPAHIMTPQGVYGSNIRINHLVEFFGPVVSRLRIFETGLSADPEYLALIPELDNRVLISNSDAHSSALHRMGREFTVIEINKFDFKGVISALRDNRIIFTAEFPPEEGRFFLTGHRAGRKSPGLHREQEFCYFSPQNVPKNDICPICHKNLTVGVFQRCIEIGMEQKGERELAEIKPRQKFIRMVPLIDILSHVLKIKTKTAKTLINQYKKITDLIGPERNLWVVTSGEVQDKLSNHINKDVLEAILEVKAGNFTFHPPGYDGLYGNLLIGTKGNFKNINVIESSQVNQQLDHYIKGKE